MLFKENLSSQMGWVLVESLSFYEEGLGSAEHLKPCSVTVLDSNTWKQI